MHTESRNIGRPSMVPLKAPAVARVSLAPMVLNPVLLRLVCMHVPMVCMVARLLRIILPRRLTEARSRWQSGSM